jgi:putative cardiolipin synthase
MKRRRSFALALLLCFVLGVGLIAALGAVPSLENRSVTTALADTADTGLGKAILPRLRQWPGMSGIYALPDAHDALAARVRLAQRAERSLDVQYYIWRNDLSGTLLLEALRDAAERGVRVRLLLDDNNTSGLDPILAALDSHPGIEVRLFNPFAIRSVRALGYLTDFFRLNRRMHNKSFTADNLATIVGGRNVGDEYFDATDGMAFVDLDVLAIGPVVAKVSADFDRYWASRSSYPADRLLAPGDAQGLARLAESAARIASSPTGAKYLDAVRNSQFMRELNDGRLAFEWADTHMVSDDPAKGVGGAAPEAMLPAKLKTIMGDPVDRVELVSAYFVPGVDGTQWFRSLASRGVKVQVLTNSLEATDVVPVHAGYAKRRKALIEAGVGLYELKRLPGRTEPPDTRASFGSSSSSLHAKTFAVDGARVFIGSFNFDPRSAELNTEMGFVIESAALTRRIDQEFSGRIAKNAYEVRLDGTGRLYWLERRRDEVIRHDVEPGASLGERAGVAVISWLPIDWLL